MSDNGWGGKREGAGRPPKALRYAQELAEAEAMLAEAAPRFVKKLLDLAEGGDVAAIRLCMDRLWGRPGAQSTPPAEDLRTPADTPGARVVDSRRAIVWREGVDPEEAFEGARLVLPGLREMYGADVPAKVRQMREELSRAGIASERIDGLLAGHESGAGLRIVAVPEVVTR
jgi:hypothetical protein